MDFDGLKAFLAVADCGSFSEAAVRMHLTQPAVSKRVAGIEQQLDQRLFDRVGRSVYLTEAGQTLYPRARKLLQDLVDARRAIDDLKASVTGKLSVVTSHHIGLHRLPTILQGFLQRYPEVELDIDFMDSDQAINALIQGRFDVAVSTLTPGEFPEVRSQLIWRDRLCCVIGNSHELAQASRLNLKQLSEHVAILPRMTSFTGKLVHQLFDQQQLPLSMLLATNNLETIKMLVSIGLGWSFLPEAMVDGTVQNMQNTHRLQVIPIEGVCLERELGFSVHRGRTLSKAAQAFIQLLASTQV